MKAELRRKLYELFDTALLAAGIRRRYRDRFTDRGDGILALIHPVDQAPKVGLLKTAIPALSQLLTDYNAGLPRASQPQRQLRVRVVLHAGEVHYDANGCFGEALDIAFRLLDAANVKKALQAAADPLILVISGDIYRAIVRNGYDGIDQRTFHPLVRVHIAGNRCPGWIHIPGQPDQNQVRHPFDACGIVPVAVPDDRRPPPPRLDGAVDPATGFATLVVTTDGFDGVSLRRDEPGLFGPAAGPGVAPPFRIRRTVRAVADPVYAHPIADGDLALQLADDGGADVFGATRTDDNGGAGLEPYVRYTYWAEVRLPRAAPSRRRHPRRRRRHHRRPAQRRRCPATAQPTLGTPHPAARSAGRPGGARPGDPRGDPHTRRGGRCRAGRHGD